MVLVLGLTPGDGVQGVGSSHRRSLRYPLDLNGVESCSIWTTDTQEQWDSNCLPCGPHTLTHMPMAHSHYLAIFQVQIKPQLDLVE